MSLSAGDADDGEDQAPLCPTPSLHQCDNLSRVSARCNRAGGTRGPMLPEHTPWELVADMDCVRFHFSNKMREDALAERTLSPASEGTYAHMVHACMRACVCV